MQNKITSRNTKEIKEAYEKFRIEMGTKYPEANIDIEIIQQIQKDLGSSIRSTEVEYFKKLAMSSLGTPEEMSFDDVERGFLRAALSDGRTGLKEYIENIPIEAPLNSAGEKYRNNGREKKQ
jgi:hypothetical protein